MHESIGSKTKRGERRQDGEVDGSDCVESIRSQCEGGESGEIADHERGDLAEEDVGRGLTLTGTADGDGVNIGAC